jgi:5-methyltetrahydrofolate--homocysteine methyltransferase
MVMAYGTDLSGKLRIGSSLLAQKLGIRSHSLMDLLDRKVPSLFQPGDPADRIIDGYTQLMSVIRCYGDAWPRWWVDFGPGIAAGFLGSNVNSDQNTVWFDRDDPIDLDTWQAVYDTENAWYQFVHELTQEAVQRWGNLVQVGVTDLGGNLDILASLRGTQQLLMDCIEHPAGVLRCARQITDVWLRYYRDFASLTDQAGRGSTCWAHLWAPGHYYMLQCDFSYMISPRMFEKFVLPDIAACCDELDYGFYHLDGKGEIPHLKHLLSLERLRGIQWIPGDGAPPPEEWLDLLKQIRDSGKLVQLYVNPEGALKITRA